MKVLMFEGTKEDAENKAKELAINDKFQIWDVENSAATPEDGIYICSPISTIVHELIGKSLRV